MSGAARRTADAAARARAMDASGSFLVQAPAGSGKTELLAQRYLALLGVVEEPESIVAITFTRKAAAEMRNRIGRLLAEALSDTEPEEEHRRTTRRLARTALERDAERGWDLAANPGRLRILTMDSLCVQLASQMPWLSRMGGTPQLSEEGPAMYAEAALRTLAMVETREEVARDLERLLLHLNNNHARAAELVAEMLGRRDQWLRHFVPSPDRAALEAGLEEVLRDALGELARRTPAEAAEFLGISELAGTDAPELTGEPETLETWLALAKLLLTDKGTVRKTVDKRLGFPPGHPRKDDCIAFLESLDEAFAAELDAVRTLPAVRYSEEQWALIEALGGVLRHAVAQLLVLFGERRVIDFVEATQRAVRALGADENPTPLAYALDFRIQHLLVDEFQDTSLSHHELLRRLTAEWAPGDGRTLFAVGDPMQSIYAFREADVGLFLRARVDGLGRLPLEPLQLAANFRSSAEMVEWFNHALPHALARSENSDYGAVTYAPAAAAREASRVAPVELHRIPESRAEAEAKCVADIVEESEGKVAILVRARKDAAGIVRELNRRRIRFQAVDMDPLTERQTVLDLHSLARAVQYPADRTALYAVLRGPLCGLTLAELTAYAAGEPLPARGEAAMERIERARRERWRRPLRESVEELWLEMGGSAALHSEAQFAEAQAYLELLETAPGEAELETELGKLFAPPDPAPEARVQIMTMHKAKGLEFDTVILPGLGRQQRNPQTPLLRWWERSRGGRSALLVGSVKATGSEGDRIYSFLQEVETRRQRHENGRLLYVAATRARRKLHLAGWLNDAKDEPAANSMLAALWPAIGEDFLRLTSLAAAAPLPAAAGEVRRLAAGWIPPKRPAPLDWELAEALPGEEIAFDWSGEPLRLVGTLVHRLLQQMAKEGLAAWPAARVAGLRGYVAGTLRAMGVPGAELEAAVDRAMQAVEAAAAGERGRWILDAHAEAVSEWEIAGAAGGRLRHVRIDRSFVDVDGVRWIIDYKTSSHEGGGLEEFLNNERERYRAQMEGYAELVTALDGRPVRLGLYFPLLGGWREWAYAPPSVSLPAGSGSGREGD